MPLNSPEIRFCVPKNLCRETPIWFNFINAINFADHAEIHAMPIRVYHNFHIHHNGKKITSLTIIYSTVADQGKHQSSTSLVFVRGIHRWPANSPHKWPCNAVNISIWWRHNGSQWNRKRWRVQPLTSLRELCGLVSSRPSLGQIFYWSIISLNSCSSIVI